MSAITSKGVKRPRPATNSLEQKWCSCQTCTKPVVFQNDGPYLKRRATSIDTHQPTLPSPSHLHTESRANNSWRPSVRLAADFARTRLRSSMAHVGMEFIQENLPIVAAIVGTVVGSAGAFLLLQPSAPPTAPDAKPAVTGAARPASSSASAPAAGSDTAAAPSVSGQPRQCCSHTHRASTHEHV